MLNDFLSGKRSYASKPGELEKKVDMEQRAEGAKLKKQEEKVEAKREKARKIER